MLKESIRHLKQINENQIQDFATFLINHKDSRIWVVGNGGSAATALHFSSDLENLGFKTICLNSNFSRITAVTNDYGWEYAYIYQMNGFSPNDILIIFSVYGGKSGLSNNLVLAATKALNTAGYVLAFLGSNGGRIGEIATKSIIVPSENQYIVEGIHSLLAHAVCEEIKKCTK